MAGAAERSQVAVYLDFDNIVMSRYDELHGPQAFRDDRAQSRRPSDLVRRRLLEARVNLDALMDFAASYGSVAIARAYADWSLPVHSSYGDDTLRRSIDLVQLFPMTKQKNGADIRLAIDAMEDLTRHPHVTHVMVVAGDSDYVALAQRCRRLGKRVIGVGATPSVGRHWRSACDEFRNYADLPGVAGLGEDEAGTETSAVERIAALAERDPASLLLSAMQLVTFKADRDWIAAGELKNMMMRLDPGFNEATLGHSRFSAFLSAHPELIEVEATSSGHRVRPGPKLSVVADGSAATPPAGVAAVARDWRKELRPDELTLHRRLVSTGPLVTVEMERALPLIIRAWWAQETGEPGPVPAMRSGFASLGGDVEAGVLRAAAHLLTSSGLPLWLHDDEGCQSANPELTQLGDDALVRLWRQWTANRARSGEDGESLSAQGVATALYGRHVPAGASEDIAATLATSSLATMTSVLGPRAMPAPVLWDVAEAAAGLKGQIGTVTAQSFAADIAPGLAALERDADTVPLAGAYTLLAEAGLAGRGAPLDVAESWDASEVGAILVTHLARVLREGGHLVVEDVTSFDSFCRLVVPDRGHRGWREWVSSAVASAVGVGTVRT